MSAFKRSLPSLGARAVSGTPPTIDEARLALGGRIDAHDAAHVGSLARFRDARGQDVEGVVVCDAGGALDVWIGEGRFQRLSRHRVELAPMRVEHALADVAADARLHAGLREGQRIRFLTRDGANREGILAERCRYGALVSHEGRVIAVSFRRLWPLGHDDA